MEIWLSCLIAYLVGSLNGSIIICDFLDLNDPRSAGSNNPGATNMMRLHGKLPALAAFSIDFTKALIICLTLPKAHMLYVYAAVCLGHIFPVFYKFKGGKGVAVTAGLILGTSIKLGLLALSSWFVIFSIFKISSLAALASIIILALSYFIPLTATTDYINLIIPCLIVILSHHSNIRRLISGTETPPVS